MNKVETCPRCGETFDHMPVVACCVHDGRATGRLNPMDPLYGKSYRRTETAQKQPASTETSMNETATDGVQ